MGTKYVCASDSLRPGQLDKLIAKIKDSNPIKKYRPSNGTEGEIFMTSFCDQCIHDNGETKLCHIIGRTMALDIDDPGYPCEWQYGDDGQPKCTKFKKDTP